MPETLSLADAAELAVVERGGFIESRHGGAALVLSSEGETVAAYGRTDALILPRSTLKPFQAVACVTAGATLQGEALALASASHTGTDRHAAVVRSILEPAGLGEDDLGCPPVWPADGATRRELIRDNAEPARIRMACSGKHATMLLACAANGWDPTSYLDPDHPLQVHIREVVERLVGERVAATVVDGCGAPIHAVTLAGLARAVHRVGSSSERSPFAMHRVAGTLVRAAREHPWAIEGPGRGDTLATEQLGVFAKSGAEGVMIVIAPDGASVTLKMLDGSGRAGLLVALSLLQRAGSLPADQVARFAEHPLFAVRGGGREAGRIRAAV